MVAVCDMLRCEVDRLGLVEKGRKKREKMVEAGLARDIRIFCGDVLDKKWGVGGFACDNRCVDKRCALFLLKDGTGERTDEKFGYM
jgi:hypothetical protein